MQSVFCTNLIKRFVLKLRADIHAPASRFAPELASTAFSFYTGAARTYCGAEKLRFLLCLITACTEGEELPYEYLHI